MLFCPSSKPQEMSDDNKKEADYSQQSESSVIDEFQPDRSCEEITSPIRDEKDVERFSEPENESEEFSADGKRNSQCSYGTENSILSLHLSLQALQALNDASAQNNDQNQNPEEIRLYEKDALNDTETATENGVFREFDSSCNSPLLNGHTVDNKADITTEKPQETHSKRNNNTSKNGRRVLSFFDRRPRSRTSPAHLSRPQNGDVAIKIDEEDSTVPEPRRPKSKSMSSFNIRLKGWLQPMDNKMNMKVFGSRKAMVEEVLRYEKAGWIIHPTSAFRYDIRSFCFLEKGKEMSLFFLRLSACNIFVARRGFRNISEA